VKEILEEGEERDESKPGILQEIDEATDPVVESARGSFEAPLRRSTLIFERSPLSEGAKVKLAMENEAVDELIVKDKRKVALT